MWAHLSFINRPKSLRTYILIMHMSHPIENELKDSQFMTQKPNGQFYLHFLHERITY